MTTKGAQSNTVPDKDDITAWLLTEHQLPVLRANAWALFLQGLTWRWIRPLVQITVDSHQPHPRPVMEEAAKVSASRSFRAAAKRHLQRAEVEQ